MKHAYNKDKTLPQKITVVYTLRLVYISDILATRFHCMIWKISSFSPYCRFGMHECKLQSRLLSS